MKRVIVVLLVALLAFNIRPAWAAMAWVQDASGSNLGSSAAVSLATLSSTNVLIVVCARHNTSLTFSSLTDNQSNAYTEHASVVYGTSNESTMRVFSAIATTTSAPTITLAITGGSGRLGLNAIEISGSFDSSRVHAAAVSNTGNGTAASSGNYVTTANDVALIACVGTAGVVGASLGTGYSNLQEDTTSRMASESKIVASTGTYVGDFTITSQLWGALVIGFVEVSAGGGGGAGHKTVVGGGVF